MSTFYAGSVRYRVENNGTVFIDEDDEDLAAVPDVEPMHDEQDEQCEGAAAADADADDLPDPHQYAHGMAYPPHLPPQDEYDEDGLLVRDTVDLDLVPDSDDEDETSSAPAPIQYLADSDDDVQIPAQPAPLQPLAMLAHAAMSNADSLDDDEGDLIWNDPAVPHDLSVFVSVQETLDDAASHMTLARRSARLQPDSAMPQPLNKDIGPYGPLSMPFRNLAHARFLARDNPPAGSIAPPRCPEQDTLFNLTHSAGILSMLRVIQNRLQHLSLNIAQDVAPSIRLLVRALSEFLLQIQLGTASRRLSGTRLTVFSIVSLSHAIPALLPPRSEVSGLAIFAYHLIDFFAYSWMGWIVVDPLRLHTLATPSIASDDEIALAPRCCPFISIAQLPLCTLNCHDAVYALYKAHVDNDALYTIV
jgi:hypothetical protein